MEPLVNLASAGPKPLRHSLRGLVSPTQSVFMAPQDASDLEKLCRAIIRGLAGRPAFTHLTSAALRGWQLPEGIEIPIIVVTDADAPHHDRRGAYIRRCGIPWEHRRQWNGLPVASAEWTIAELAEDLSLLDLVAMIDSALHLEQCTVDSIWAVVIPGRRGVRNLRRALAYVDGRSESFWESMLRMLHVLSGVRVEAQQILVDVRGVFVARMDLWIVGTVRYPEYDGEHHREVARHRKDLRREKGASRMGAERYGYTASEIRHEADRILRDADQALKRPHDISRLKWWLAEAELSTITPAGRRRLTRRLTRFDRRISKRREAQG